MIWLTGLRIALGRFASKLPWQIWAALAVAAVLGVSAWIINDRAFSRGFAEAERQWEQQVQEELERQQAANDAALRAAREEIERLNEARRVRDATIERLNREAREDPNAGRPALGADSVRRLNSVLE
ncbi:MAG TPA: hypothetical protein VIG24_15540 [Acidimicrobiia bacterium]